MTVATRARLRMAPLWAVAAAGFVALGIGLVVGQGAAEQLLVDPGATVRYGLPGAMLVLRIASSLTLGALLFAAFALPSTEPAYERTMQVAAVSAGVWTVASAVAAF